MMVKPNTAFTGTPSGRVIGGSAWKARNRKPEPSIRTRCRSAALAPGAASAACSGAGAAGASMFVVGAVLQHVEPRAIGAHHRVVHDAQIDARMAERGVAAVAGDHAAIHHERLRGRGGRGWLVGSGGGNSVRHRNPLWRLCGSDDSLEAHDFNVGSPGLMRRRGLVLAAAALGLQGCVGDLGASARLNGPPPAPDGVFVMRDGARLPYRVWLPDEEG